MKDEALKHLHDAHEAALAIRTGATAQDLAKTIHAHPTLSEAIMEAGEALLGQAIHLPPTAPMK